MTHGQLLLDAEQVAGALVAAADRVAPQIEKSTATIALYLGKVLSEAVYLTLNP